MDVVKTLEMEKVSRIIWWIRCNHMFPYKRRTAVSKGRDDDAGLLAWKVEEGL